MPDEHVYRLAVEQVADYAIFMVDAHGRMASWNRGVRHVLGWEEAEFLGQPFSILFPPEDLPDGPRLELGKAELTGCAENDRWQVKRDGTRFWASGITTGLRDGRGRPNGFLKVMRDLTERKRTEEELQRAKLAAEEASRAKDDFLAALSHELRTPLTPVLLTVSLLEGRPDLPADVRDEIETIRRNVELEARLIDDLLDLTRIIRGKLQYAFEPADAHLLIRRAMDICGRDEGIRTVADLAATRREVWADPARLQQVFWNLLNNAYKFTPGGGTVTIATRTTEDLRLVISVSDTGVGIEPDVLPKVFGAFEQGGAATTRRFGGLGLGLAISQTIVSAHGGTLTAQSRGPGQGATFIVEMPTITPTDVPTEVGRDTRGASGVLASSARSLRILLVEDDEGTRVVMARLLSRVGHTVSIAGSVRDAVLSAGREPFDLLISDLGLPDGTGHDVVRAVTGAQKGIKAIAVTGHGTDDNVRQGESAGFAAHLTKPMDLAQLVAAIERVMA